MSRSVLWGLLWLTATAGIAACVVRPNTTIVAPPPAEIDEPVAYPIHTYQRA